MRCSARQITSTCRKLSRLKASKPVQRGCETMSDRGTAAPLGKPKVIIVTGPTAVGKTKIGLELAKRLGGEVISADSVQVHTGLDVGSDKVG